MTYEQYLKKYSPNKWAKRLRESRRKPFETDDELDMRLLVACMVKKARRIIREGLERAL